MSDTFSPHNDEPILDDLLDRTNLVRSVARHIADCTAPQVFGIHGDWGAGKTSFLKQLRHHLASDLPDKDQPKLVSQLGASVYGDRVITIWFEAWRYQNEPVPVVALLQEMRRQFGLLAKVKKGLGKLSEVAFRSILSSFADATKFIGIEAAPINPEKIQAAGERWEKEHLEERLSGDTIKDFLTQAIDALLPQQSKKDMEDGRPKPRVVVLIDDLDRCSPESAYKLLEGLKIYLNLSNCVFVLGMNQQVVVEAIAKNLSKETDNASVKLRAEAYLEKLCSNIWRLPLIKSPTDYLLRLTRPNEFSTGLKSALTHTGGEAAGTYVKCLPPNARRVKALANLLCRLYEQSGLSMKAKWLDTANPPNPQRAARALRAFVVVAYVYQFHSEIYQRWHYDTDFFKLISEWANGVSGSVIDPTKGSDVPKYFDGLKLPMSLIASSGSSSSPTPGGALEIASRYPDPAEAGMFWIAALLHAEPSGFVASDFREYLLHDSFPA